MTLYGQGYVSPDRFIALLKETVTPLLIRKAPVVLAETIRSGVRSTGEISPGLCRRVHVE